MPSKEVLCLSTVMFIGSLGFSIILPSLWPRLEELGESKTFLGWTVASFCLGQGLGAVILGKIANSFAIRTVIAFSLCLDILGNVIYCFAGSPSVIMAARFVYGVGAGNAGVARAYASATTKRSARTAALAWLTASQSAGYIVGPAIGGSFDGIREESSGIMFDEFTLPAWVAGGIAILNLVFLGFFFKIDKSLKELVIEAERQKALTGDESGLLPLVNLPEPSKIGIAMCLVSNVVVVMTFSLFETMVTPITKDLYYWDPSATGIFFAIASATATTCLILIRWVADKVNDLAMFVGGSLIMVLADMAMVSFWGGNLDLWRFWVGMIFTIGVGYPFAMVNSFSIYSKVLGPRPQGTMMGWITFAASFARFIGPIAGTYIYEHSNESVLFASQASLVFVMVVGNVALKKHLEPLVTEQEPPPQPQPSRLSTNDPEKGYVVLPEDAAESRVRTSSAHSDAPSLGGNY